MKLNSAQVERALKQFEAQALPDDHPVVPQFASMFGEHTFFLDSGEPQLPGTDGGYRVGGGRRHDRKPGLLER